MHLQYGRPGFNPWVGKIPWRKERLPTPVFWPGEFHGLYSPWGRKESDTTEHPSLSLGNISPIILINLEAVSSQKPLEGCIVTVVISSH